MRAKISESGPSIVVVIRCFRFTRSIGRLWTNTLFFTVPTERNHRVLSQDFSGWPLSKWSVVARDLSDPSLRHIFIEVIPHVGRLVCWCSIQLKNEVINVVLQL
ncbi:hypothetical protein TNCV_2053831 [Trichonephila clavipes]|nr:hypothetical protein TNCV_2053831 [Trichonephila clavipes]